MLRNIKCTRNYQIAHFFLPEKLRGEREETTAGGGGRVESRGTQWLAALLQEVGGGVSLLTEVASGVKGPKICGACCVVICVEA